MKVISLFSGAGGLDLGFINAGFEVVWANDNYRDAVETYKSNIGDHIVCADISEINAVSIPDGDVVIGGFPCQGFSVANMKRSETDGRNQLYLQFVRILHEKKPRYFLAENVKGILSLGKGKIFETIKEDFSAAGYEVRHAILNSADYGVPETRVRVFIFGVRKDIECSFKHFPPPPSHANPEKAKASGLKPWVSVGEALQNIPDPDQPNNLPNHKYSKYKLDFNGYLGHRMIDPSKPAPTVTARGDEKGGVVILPHPNNARRMSVRELATVQSFPLHYIFCGNKTSGYRQIGNAVPPLLAKAIAQAILLSSEEARI